jgi:membrane protease YdiL (CAAX protease family)
LLAFGGVHMVNAGETLAGIAAIAFVYGPMLTAPFMVTRRLWASIGLHGARNYSLAVAQVWRVR